MVTMWRTDTGLQGNEGLSSRLSSKLEDAGLEYCALSMERIQEPWPSKAVPVAFVVLEFFMSSRCKHNSHIEISLRDLKIMLNNWHLCLFLETDLVFVDFGANSMFLSGSHLI